MDKLFAILGIIKGVTDAVVLVQDKMGAEPGKTKQAEVERLVMDSLETAEIVSGEDIVDEKGFRKGLKKVTEGIVLMLKSTKFWNRQ